MQWDVSTLKRVIFKIMSEMYFLFPDEEDVPLPDDAYTAGSYVYQLNLQKQGSLTVLFFRFDNRLAQKMCEYFLGINREEVTPESIQGTIGECVNMVVGNLLNEIDDRAEINMGVPRLLDCWPAGLTGAVELEMSFEGYPFKVLIQE